MRGEDGGAATIEFAFVVPIMIFIMLVTVDFGRFELKRLLVSNAAQEAVRLAGTGPSVTLADLGQRVQQTTGHTDFTVTWTGPCPPDAGPTDYVLVYVSYKPDWLFFSGIMARPTITTRGVMQCQG